MKKALLCWMFMGVCVSPALGQFRPPVRPAPPVTPRPTTVTATSAARPAVVTRPAATTAAARPPATATAASPPRPRTAGPAPHGNGAASNRPQTVYGIFETKRSTGETRLVKVGISGSTPRQSVNRVVSPRAENQVRTLNLKTPDSAFRSRVIQQIPSQPAGQPTARQLALTAEKQAVTRFSVARGGSPVGNLRPTPAPFSRVNLPQKP